MTAAKRWIWLLWIVLIAASALQISLTRVVTDATSFLPGPANADQRLMTEQLRDGLSTRMLIVGLRLPDGAAPQRPDAAQSAALRAASRALRSRLAGHKAFAWVSNGDFSEHAAERERLFAARYLLSPAIAPSTFSTAGLADAFGRLERELVSFRGSAIRSIAPADPTLEALHLRDKAAGQFAAGGGAAAWFAADGRAALLMLETSARGHDIAGMRAAIGLIRGEAQLALEAWPAALPKPVVEFAGAGYFNVRSHDAIGQDAEILSLIATVLVCALLLWALRSPRFLGLAIIPVATGALAGFAAVGAIDGSIHGITLAFGITLLGEAVDYAIYTFVQRDSEGRHGRRFWMTLALAVLTSLLGFAAMFFSGFQGLRQLGLFSIVGLAVAAACTRWLLPGLLPPSHGAARRPALDWLPGLAHGLRRLRWPVVAIALACAALLIERGDRLWLDSLDTLSASSPEDNARDQRWRDDIGLAELRSMVAVRGASLDEALARAEVAGVLLDQLVRDGELRGYDSPAALLPSQAVQRGRQAALPEPEILRARVREALQGSSLRPAAFEPFIADAAAARSGPLLDLAYYDQTIIGRWLSAQIVESGDGVAVLILLRGLAPQARIDLKIRQAELPGVTRLDLQRDVEVLVAGYRQRTLHAALAGAAAILLILALRLPSLRAFASMLATLVTTIVVTAGCVLLKEGHLTVFNLVALLLVAGVASNYTLFFSTLPPDPAERRQTSLSVLLAAGSTFIVFAVLAGSSTPILAMIGTTVAIGAAVGLLASMVFSPR